jgi:hypothetical protein
MNYASPLFDNHIALGDAWPLYAILIAAGAAMLIATLITRRK